MKNGHWINLDIESIKGLSGFLYIITNLISGKRYIGLKHFWCKRKGIRLESNWRSYVSSCKALKLDIKTLGLDKFQFEAIEVFTNKAKLKTAEAEYIIRNNCVLDDNWYNANVYGIQKHILKRLYDI